MKVLWLTNKILPQVDKARGKDSRVVNEGWISQMFDQITSDSRYRMRVVCMGSNEDQIGSARNFDWRVIKAGLSEELNYSETIECKLVNTLKEFQPEVIHIWGSEYPHTLAMVNAAISTGLIDRVVISLQGIMYMCATHYLNGVPPEIINKRTFYDIVRHNSLKNQQKRFEKRGEYEMEAIMKVKHVIGRTVWDRYSVERINPNLIYHHCNETLREPFYRGSWKYSACKKHSIFMSQATYPIKGMHYFLRALPKLIERYPDLVINIAGNDITKTNSFVDKLKISSYGLYLKRMIEKNGLGKHFNFLGRLDAIQMKEQYLSANVFVSPSLIENSPNSVGEAMLLGCPVVSSNVGGVSSIIEHEKEGFTYPVDEFYMLEYYVSKVFDMGEEIESISYSAKEHACITHNPETNLETLLSIYYEIAK